MSHQPPPSLSQAERAARSRSWDTGIGANDWQKRFTPEQQQLLLPAEQHFRALLESAREQSSAAFSEAFSAIVQLGRAAEAGGGGSMFSSGADQGGNQAQVFGGGLAGVGAGYELYGMAGGSMMGSGMAGAIGAGNQFPYAHQGQH